MYKISNSATGFYPGEYFLPVRSSLVCAVTNSDNTACKKGKLVQYTTTYKDKPA